MTAQKWNYKTHEYEPYELPLNATLFEYDLGNIVACARCGSQMIYGNSYTSLEIHNSIGIGYAVCEKCYDDEWERKRSDTE